MSLWVSHFDTKLIKMIKLLLLSLLIIAIAFALLSIKLLLKRNGKFSSQHVHDNPGLRKLESTALWIRTARHASAMVPIKVDASGVK